MISMRKTKVAIIIGVLTLTSIIAGCSNQATEKKYETTVNIETEAQMDKAETVGTQAEAADEIEETSEVEEPSETDDETTEEVSEIEETVDIGTSSEVDTTEESESLTDDNIDYEYEPAEKAIGINNGKIVATPTNTGVSIEVDDDIDDDYEWKVVYADGIEGDYAEYDGNSGKTYFMLYPTSVGDANGDVAVTATVQYIRESDNDYLESVNINFMVDVEGNVYNVTIS